MKKQDPGFYSGSLSQQGRAAGDAGSPVFH